MEKLSLPKRNRPSIVSTNQNTTTSDIANKSNKWYQNDDFMLGLSLGSLLTLLFILVFLLIYGLIGALVNIF